MNEEQTQVPLVKLRIKMDRSFSDFGQKEREEFLKDLSTLTGFPQEEFQGIVFRKGCVIFEGELGEEAVKRLVENYRKRNEKGRKDDEDLESLQDFIKRHLVTYVTDDLRIVVHIPKKPRSSPQIVFVHGWRGGQKSFGKLPKYLTERLGYENLVYSYPTSSFSDSPEITFVSRNLDNWFRTMVDADQVAVIAHSMGGIITRKLIVNQFWRDEPLDERIKLVTLIASPNDGAGLAKVATKIPILEKSQLSDISYASTFMYELNDMWEHWVQHHVPNLCHVRSVFGTNDNTVPEINARGLDRNAVPILGANHTSIIKPKNPEDEIVITLDRFIRDAFKKT